MDRSNVILIGMSGAGKSTLGVLLAKALGKDFVDTDIMIQQKAGCLLQDMIDRRGEDRFLALEEEVLSGIEYNNYVIATGGSAVYSDKAMTHLRKLGKVVYLHVEYDEIERRIGGGSARGIIFRNAGSLNEVYSERLGLYEKYADISVDCTGSTLADTVAKIKTLL